MRGMRFAYHNHNIEAQKYGDIVAFDEVLHNRSFWQERLNSHRELHRGWRRSLVRIWRRICGLI